jgi:hypothetical protein
MVVSALAGVVCLANYWEKEMEDEDDSSLRIAASYIVLQELARKYPTLDWMGDGQPDKKKRYIMYDRERAKLAVFNDYLSLNAYFNDRQFIRMLRVSPTVYETIRAAVQKHSFFTPKCEVDAIGREPIDLNVKIVMALKQLGFGCAPVAFVDYLQMGASTGTYCLEYFLDAIMSSQEIIDVYLRRMTKSDARRVAAMHKEVHGVDGNIGSIDCMHVRWKNCPTAYQGICDGKEKGPTLVLEAAGDYSLWIWWATFGFPGTLNDINIWDNSPIHRSMVDGTMESIDFNYRIAGKLFEKLWYSVDGIYPLLERFVKTISVPLGTDEKRFSVWQESTRKMIERAFGVLQRKF